MQQSVVRDYPALVTLVRLLAFLVVMRRLEAPEAVPGAGDYLPAIFYFEAPEHETRTKFMPVHVTTRALLDCGGRTSMMNWQGLARSRSWVLSSLVCLGLHRDSESIEVIGHISLIFDVSYQGWQLKLMFLALGHPSSTQRVW